MSFMALFPNEDKNNEICVRSFLRRQACCEGRQLFRYGVLVLTALFQILNIRTLLSTTSCSSLGLVLHWRRSSARGNWTTLSFLERRLGTLLSCQLTRAVEDIFWFSDQLHGRPVYMRQCSRRRCNPRCWSVWRPAMSQKQTRALSRRGTSTGLGAPTRGVRSVQLSLLVEEWEKVNNRHTVASAVDALRGASEGGKDKVAATAKTHCMSLLICEDVIDVRVVRSQLARRLACEALAAARTSHDQEVRSLLSPAEEHRTHVGPRSASRLASQADR